MQNENPKNIEDEIQKSPDDEFPNDKYWWNYELDWEKRKRDYPVEDKDDVSSFSNRNLSLTDFESKNRPNYREYIQVDKLLDSQVPLSTVPDERIFIIVHQMFELVFKQMKFDFEIIADTLERLMKDDENFEKLAGLEMPQRLHNYEPEFLAGFIKNETPVESVKRLIEFWQPAIFAANRLFYSSSEMLDSIGAYFSKINFSGFEFAQFRPLLLPASGFQTEQFRTIQRILGKEKLLEYIIFASHEFSYHYHAKKTARDNPENQEHFTSVTADRIYDKANKSHVRDWKKESSHKREEKSLIRLVNQILARLSLTGKNEIAPSIPGEHSDNSQLETVVREFEKYISGLDAFTKAETSDALKEQTIKTLRDKFEQKLVKDLEPPDKAVDEEIRKGAFILRSNYSKTVLFHIFDKLSKIDEALHGRKRSFLKGHITMAKSQIDIVTEVDGMNDPNAVRKGTGGGGGEYLNFMLELYQLFPAFPALKETV